MPRRATLFTAIVSSLFFASGCGGPKLHPVSGTVTLDGNPVEGAAVTFMSDDGKNTYAGLTDASGKYTLYAGEKPGASAGSYKVLVTKPKKVEGDMTPGSADYLKQMAKATKESATKETTGAFNPAMAGGGGSVGPKGDLPPMYSAATTTPFSATVPPPGPVDLALTTPKGAKK